MTKRAFAAAAALLVQACASTPPPPPEPKPQNIPAASQPSAQPPAANPKPAPVQPAQPAAGSGVLDTAKLPPFEGERHEIAEPLRGVRKVDRTAQADDLWQRVRQGFAMPDLDNDLVRKQTAYYASRPEYLQRMFDRSRIYLYHIVDELEKRNLPTELALLPMVESAFNPMAYSRAHASGLWQFIPGTGRRFELQQNWWYDGRRDIVESTKAALDYLTFLYEMHGDWHLALASYNWGEGAVARAIAQNRKAGKPTDYASLKMPAETRQYVPKLQALKNIIANPGPLGITLDPIPNQPYFATVTKLRDIDVRLAAKLAEMPVEEFIALNPGFSRPIIRAAVTPRIVLPADKVDVFHDNLEKYNAGALVSWKTYHPKKGDTFESIAKKSGMSVGQLKEVNGIAPRTRIVPNLLVVPSSPAAAAVETHKLPLMYAPPIPVVTRRIYHTVKPGETLTSIAKRYGVAVEDMKRWNAGVRFAPGTKVAVEVRASAKKTKRAKAKAKTYKQAVR
ncbi:MAG TPA: transglycosylase SLT domain-containing protein [Burkholderiales bacterium]|jgi:membrane-bound lytic murein transglycosylase D